MENPAYTKKHWIILIFVALMMGSSVGLLTNGNGIFYAPMSNELGYARGAISIHVTFKMLATAYASLSIPKLIENYKLKPILALGVGLSTLGTALMAFSNTLPMIYFLGIIRGVGSAFYSLVPMSMILNRWFKKHRGVAIGLASGTSGIVGSIAAPMLTLINENIGWRQGFFVKSIFVLLLGLPIILLPFKLNPEEENLLPYGYSKKEERGFIHRSEIKEISPTNFIYIGLLVIGFFNTLVLFMNSHFPSFGESVGLTADKASLMLSAVMIGNLVWKFILGSFSDRIGPVKSSLFMIGFSVSALVIMILFHNPITLILGSFFFGAIFSISGVALPILSNRFFGLVAGAKVYSKVNFLVSFGGAFGVGATGLIYDYTGSYINAFIIALFLLLINAGILIISEKMYQKEKLLIHVADL